MWRNDDLTELQRYQTTKLERSKSLPRQASIVPVSAATGIPQKTRGTTRSHSSGSSAAAKQPADAATKSPGSSFLSGWMLLTPPTQLLRRRQAERRRQSAANGGAGGNGRNSFSKFSTSSSFQPQPSTSNAARPWTKSVLTQLLIRLDENLNEYCDCLSTGKVASASKLLDTSEATIITPTSSATSSPASHPTLSPAAAAASLQPPMSPIRAAMFVNRGQQQQQRTTSPLGKLSPSILALEAEWERYVSPFLCLAGAEAMYGQMEHILLFDLNMKLVLQNLYQRIHEDFMSVKADLCDPFLAGQEETTTSGPFVTRTATATSVAMTTATQAALSLSKSIQTLLQFVTSRQKLIQLQSDLFFSSFRIDNNNINKNKNNKDLPSLQKTVQKLWDDSVSTSSLRKSRRTKEQCGSALSLMLSLDDEIKATKAVISAVNELEHCSFMNTIIQTKILKNYMKSPPNSVLQVWLQVTLEHILSVMPIFFDRIDAYSRPLYGFDKSRMIVADHNEKNTKKEHRQQQQQQQQKQKQVIGIVHDYDAFIIDFLRRHETKGGQPMAISIVLDAKRTSNLHLERGVVPPNNFQQQQQQQSSATNNTDSSASQTQQQALQMNHEIDEWPAIYMRTTIHSGTLSSNTTNSRSPLSRSPSASSTRSTVGGTKASISSMMNKLGHSRNLLKVPSKRDIMGDGSIGTTAGSDHHGSIKSEVNLLHSWSNDSPKGSARKRGSSGSGSVDGGGGGTNQRNHFNNVLEYAPDSGKLSWPHDEWNKLVPLLLNERTETDNARGNVGGEPNDIISKQDVGVTGGSMNAGVISTNTITNSQAVTYQGVGESSSSSNNTNTRQERQDVDASSHSTISLPSPNRASSSNGNNNNNTSSSSIFHVNRLGEYMWMVVLVKTEDGSKWHRRKRSRGHSDEEIRSFLGGIASKLRLEPNIFGIEGVQKAQSCSSKASKHICTTDLAKYCNLSSTSDNNSIKDDDDNDEDDEDSYWTDADIDNFVVGVKDSFGLQPESRMRRALKGTRGWQTVGGGANKSKFRSSTRNRSRRGVDRQAQSLDNALTMDDEYLDSAIAFFLGTDLMKTLE